VPSDEELLAVCNPLVLTPEEGNRALFAYGYEHGLAAGRAEQQAATEESSAAQSSPAEQSLATPPAPSLEPRGCPTAPIVPPELIRALELAEAAMADIGDADREPGDDIAWAEHRAAEDLPRVRHALETWRDHATPPAATREAGPLPQAGAEIITEEWDALKERLWDQHETVGHQGERFMWFSGFDAALDEARAVLARWGGAAVPAADKGEGQGWDARGATKAPAVKDSLTAAQPPAFTEESVQRGNVNGWPSTEKPAIMPKPQCPPLGLKPRWLADEQRLQEVADAINRYRKAGVAIPLEWLDEYDELGRRLQHSSPPQPQGGRMVGPEP
jgi:hypothetical protein